MIISKTDHYTLPRETFQPSFQKYLHEAGFDARGYRNESWESSFPTVETETETFVITPYDQSKTTGKPNFVNKENGLCIWWYKWPLREATSNKPTTTQEITLMLQRLVEQTHRLGATPTKESSDYMLKDTLNRYELIDEIAKTGTFDNISQTLQGTLQRMLAETKSLRRPQSADELRWAIRLDQATTEESIIIAVQTRHNRSKRGVITTRVSVNANDEILVTRTMSANETKAGTTAVLFSGDAQAFNETAWSFLTMERLGKDCPDMSYVAVTQENVHVGTSNVAIEKLRMLDVETDSVDGTPKRVNGALEFDIAAKTHEGVFEITVHDDDGTKHCAKLSAKDLRTICLLCELRENYEFDIDIERDAAAARVQISDAEMSVGLDEMWKRMNIQDAMPKKI